MPYISLDSAADIGVPMTLATIAYAEPPNIPLQLAYPKYATADAYTCVWTGVSPSHQMYVAQARGQQRWFVAIRGSVTDPFTFAFWENWFNEDFPWRTAPLPFGDAPDARIGTGTLDGLNALVGMRDPRSGLTLLEFLGGQQLDAFSVMVVGHSLGGALASVLAPWLYENLCKAKGLPPECVWPVTFAAPTAGNAAFAAYVEQLYQGFPHRFVNDLDVAPRVWSLADRDWFMQSYQPSPTLAGSDLQDAAELAWWWVDYWAFGFTQPGPGVAGAGALANYYWWFQEAGYQHHTSTYLGLYHAPPVMFPLPPPQRTVASTFPRAADFARRAGP